MEVVLIKAVNRLGRVGDIVSVRDGFGRNYLIPQQFAIRATEANKKMIEQKRHELEAKNAAEKEVAISLVEKIKGTDLIFIRQSSDDGKLFGSVSNKEIAKALSSASGQVISHNAIIIDAPIKLLGANVVHVMLHPEVSTEILVAIGRSESEAHDMVKNHKAASHTTDVATSTDSAEA